MQSASNAVAQSSLRIFEMRRLNVIETIADRDALVIRTVLFPEVSIQNPAWSE